MNLPTRELNLCNYSKLLKIFATVHNEIRWNNSYIVKSDKSCVSDRGKKNSTYK